MLSAGRDYTVRTWSIDRKEMLSSKVYWDHAFSDPIVSSDGRWVAIPYSEGGETSERGCVELISRPGNEKQVIRTEHRPKPRSVAFAPNDDLLATGGWTDRRVTVWDLPTRSPVHSYGGHESAVTALAFSPPGTALASGDGDGWILVWDLKSQERLHKFRIPGTISTLAFSPAGDWLAGGSSLADRGRPRIVGEVRVWDTATGLERARWRKGLGGVKAVAFSPDGTRLAVGTAEGQVIVRAVETGEEVFATDLRNRMVHSVAFSPDNAWLAAGTGMAFDPCEILLWRLAE